MPELILHTINGSVEPLTDFEEVKRKRTTEGEFSLSFLITRTERNAAQFDQLQNKNKIELDGNLFVIDDVDRDPEGTTVMKEISARHEMFDRLASETVEQKYTGQKPLNAWLDIVLAGTGLTYEIIGTFPSEQFDDFGMDNDKSSEMFKDLIERFGVEYRPFGTHLIIAKEIGQITEAQFRHGHNLKTFGDNFNTDDLVTQVTAHGKNGEDGKPLVSVTVKSPNADKFERLYKIVVQDERFTNQQTLTAYAKTHFNEGKYSAKVEYEELVKNGLKLHNFDVGDYIWVIYEMPGMDIDLQARIMSVEDYPFDPYLSPVVELGNFQNDVTRSIATLQRTGKQITTLKNGYTQISADMVLANQAVESAQQIITQNQESFTQHLNDNIRHITDAERQQWNSGISSGDVEQVIGAHANRTDNPHQVTKQQVGLGSVDDIQQATKQEFQLHTIDQLAHWTQEQRDVLEKRLIDIENRLAALES